MTVDEPAEGEEQPVADEHTTGNVGNPTDADQHGVEVSGTARSTDTSGRDHGRAVSEVARDGHGASTTTSTSEPRGASGHAAPQATDNPSSGHRP